MLSLLLLLTPFSIAPVPQASSAHLAGAVKSIRTTGYSIDDHGDTVQNHLLTISRYNRFGRLTYFKREGEENTTILEYTYYDDTLLQLETYRGLVTVGGTEDHSAIRIMYDYRKGRLVSSRSYNSEGHINARAVYQYAAGNLVREESFSDRNKYPTTIKNYDQWGNETEVIYCLKNATGTLFIRTTNEYDTQNRKVRQYTAASDGSYATITWMYGHNRVTEVHEEEKEGQKTHYREVKQYNEQGNLTDHYSYRNNEATHDTYTYILLNGHYEKKTYTQHSSRGCNTTRYRYTDIDKNGNWHTRITSYQKGKDITQRDVAYYH